MGQEGYQFVFRGTHCVWGCIDDTIAAYKNDCSCWCIPEDLYICRLKIEVWGAGGQGSNTRCRAAGFTGQSGEYKSKILCADSFNSGNYFDGMCFQYVAAQPRCCNTCNGGCHGCYSWVCGPNNFEICAKGGCGGILCGHCCCSSRSFVCGCWYGGLHGCGIMEYNFCNYHPNESGSYNNSSETNFPRNTDTVRACNDIGCCYHASVSGAIAVQESNDDRRNNCSVRWYNPYPAGINSTDGGYNVIVGATSCCCSCFCHFEHYNFNRPGVWPMGSGNAYKGGVGSGGLTQWGGGDDVCRCGGAGTGGAVRFTLFPDLSVSTQ